MADILLTANGVIDSAVIEQHARAFALDYLRHTILGTPRVLDSEPTHGPLIVAAEAPKILSPQDEKLILMPDENEKQQYAPKPTSPAKPPPLLDEGFLLKRFQKHINKATIGGSITAELELQRTAISIQMERVLDNAAANDVAAFNEAYADLEGMLTTSIRTLLPKLGETGILLSQANTMLQELAETSIKAAIDTRTALLDDQGERNRLCENYEGLLNAYHDKQQNFAEAVKEQRRNVKPTARIQRYFVPIHPALSKPHVRWRDRDLLTEKGEGMLKMADNENERSR